VAAVVEADVVETRRLPDRAPGRSPRLHGPAGIDLLVPSVPWEQVVFWLREAERVGSRPELTKRPEARGVQTRVAPARGRLGAPDLDPVVAPVDVPPLQALDLAGSEAAVEGECGGDVREDPLRSRSGNVEEPLLFSIRQRQPNRRLRVPERAIVKRGNGSGASGRRAANPTGPAPVGPAAPGARDRSRAVGLGPGSSDPMPVWRDRSSGPLGADLVAAPTEKPASQRACFGMSCVCSAQPTPHSRCSGQP